MFVVTNYDLFDQKTFIQLAYIYLYTSYQRGDNVTYIYIIILNYLNYFYIIDILTLCSQTGDDGMQGGYLLYYIHMYIPKYVYLYTHFCIHISISREDLYFIIRVFICIYTCVHIHMYIYICIYLNIYICIHIYTHIYI
jgi:hypothetical protein